MLSLRCLLIAVEFPIRLFLLTWFLVSVVRQWNKYDNQGWLPRRSIEEGKSNLLRSLATLFCRKKLRFAGLHARNCLCQFCGRGGGNQTQRTLRRPGFKIKATVFTHSPIHTHTQVKSVQKEQPKTQAKVAQGSCTRKKGRREGQIFLKGFLGGKVIRWKVCRLISIRKYCIKLLFNKQLLMEKLQHCGGQPMVYLHDAVIWLTNAISQSSTFTLSGLISVLWSCRKKRKEWLQHLHTLCCVLQSKPKRHKLEIK